MRQQCTLKTRVATRISKNFQVLICSYLAWMISACSQQKEIDDLTLFEESNSRVFSVPLKTQHSGLREHEFNQLKTPYNKECDVLFKKTTFKTELDLYLDRAVNLAGRGETRVDSHDFQLNYLNHLELLEFYHSLRFCEGIGNNIFSKLAFEAKDRMIRLSLKSSQAKQTFLKSLDESDQSLFFPTHSSFLSIKENSLNDGNLQTMSINNDRQNISSNAERPLLVLHAAVEAPNVRVGGIGSFLDGLIRAENTYRNLEDRKVIDARIISPFYDLLKRKLSVQSKFIGLLPHFIDGEFYESSVYEVLEGGTRQYLIQPDPLFDGSDLFGANSANKVYQLFISARVLLYHSSAVAAFSALFRGSDQSETIDVLHLNAWHLGLAAMVLNKSLNEKRVSAGLPKVSIVSTVHILNGEQGEKDGRYLRRLGLSSLRYPTLNLHVLTQLQSDISTTVSLGVAEEMKKKDHRFGFGVGHLFEFLYSHQRFFSIQNGIDYDTHFNVRNSTILGQLKVSNDLSDLEEKKRQAKQILFDRGIIGSPDKPLYLYVGRFANEKGIDILPEFAHFALDRRAQVVVMGSMPEGSIKNILNELEQITHPDFKLYQNVETDQLEEIQEYSITKGKLIRFAADFTIIPSKNESFGLVALEAFSMGGGTITTFVQGLKDMCKPYKEERTGTGFSQEEFNAFGFIRATELRTTVANMKDSLSKGLDMWESLTPQQKLEAKQRWIKEAADYSWDRQHGPVEQYRDVYVRAMKLPRHEKEEHYKEFLRSDF